MKLSFRTRNAATTRTRRSAMKALSKRMIMKTKRTKRVRKLKKLQTKELSGYPKKGVESFLAMPPWLLRTYQTIMAGIVSLTMGSAAMASAKGGKGKAQVVQKEKSPQAPVANASVRASVTIIKNAISVRMSEKEGKPEIDTDFQYTVTEEKNGSITYNLQ